MMDNEEQSILNLVWEKKIRRHARKIPLNEVLSRFEGFLKK